MRYTCTLRDGAGSLAPMQPPTRRHGVVILTKVLTIVAPITILTYQLMQRHRLHAFGEFERGQAGRPDFRKTDSPHNLLASGVRASFRAWI